MGLTLIRITSLPFCQNSSKTMNGDNAYSQWNRNVMGKDWKISLHEIASILVRDPQRWKRQSATLLVESPAMMKWGGPLTQSGYSSTRQQSYACRREVLPLIESFLIGDTFSLSHQGVAWSIEQLLYRKVQLLPHMAERYRRKEAS